MWKEFSCPHEAAGGLKGRRTISRTPPGCAGDGRATQVPGRATSFRLHSGAQPGISGTDFRRPAGILLPANRSWSHQPDAPAWVTVSPCITMRKTLAGALGWCGRPPACRRFSGESPRAGRLNSSAQSALWRVPHGLISPRFPKVHNDTSDDGLPPIVPVCLVAIKIQLEVLGDAAEIVGGSRAHWG